MKILIVNVDSVIPNLALCKITKYHKDKGDDLLQIKDNDPVRLPLHTSWAEKIYVSCVFDYNKRFCKKWEGIAEIGGSGYSLVKKLPPEIEEIKPRINLGFATRGCIRNCYFCIVRKKEGKIKAVADIYDIWDGVSKEIILLDNNILALPKHFFKISKQLKKEKLKVDFNQGLDFRLLTDNICKELFSLRHVREIRFAFDNLSYKSSVIKALELLKKNGLKDWQTRWYVYVGTKDTLNTVLERVNLLRDAKQLVYLMKDRKVADKPEFSNDLLVWCNFVGLYKKNHYYKGILEANKKTITLKKLQSLFDK